MRNNTQDSSMFQFTGNMPDVLKKDAVATYQIGAYTVLLSTDVTSVAERFAKEKIPEKYRMHCKYVLTVADLELNSPKLFVTLERFGQGPYMLGVVHPGGSHDNYGTMPDPDDINEFIVRGFNMIKIVLNIQGDPVRIDDSIESESKQSVSVAGSSSKSNVSRNSFASLFPVTSILSNVFIIVAACICAFAFYWYEYRPSQIRSSCQAVSIVNAQHTMKSRARLEPYKYADDAANGFFLYSDQFNYFNDCLRENGLEPSSENSQ